MPVRIVRFGGNNLKNREVITNLLSLLNSADDNHLIIVSATNEIQHQLTTGIQLIARKQLNPEILEKNLKDILNTFIQEYELSDFSETENLLIDLHQFLQGIYQTGDYSAALYDQVLSYAEKLTTALLFSILKKKNLSTQICYPEKIGLIVTEEYANASIRLKASSDKIRSFQFQKVNLIPGSYGQTESGKTARIGFRAADYTAAALANILDATELELWQIGKPFKTASDHIVEQAEYIDALTYSELSELSYFSNSGIFPRIVEPLIDKKIPIHIYQLKNGTKILRTKINSHQVTTPGVVKCITNSDDIAILKLNGPGVGFKPGILARITTAFTNQQINIRSVITAQTSINILIDKAHAEKARQITQNLELSSVNEVELNTKVSLIAIVGCGMQQHHGISASLFQAVANNKINVLLSGSGASDLVSYLMIDEQDTNKAIQEIHKIFFNN